MQLQSASPDNVLENHHWLTRYILLSQSLEVAPRDPKQGNPISSDRNRPILHYCIPCRLSLPSSWPLLSRSHLDLERGRYIRYIFDTRTLRGCGACVICTPSCLACVYTPDMHALRQSKKKAAFHDSVTTEDKHGVFSNPFGSVFSCVGATSKR